MSRHVRYDLIARWYNERVERDPFNPPTCRQVAEFAGLSGTPSSGHHILKRLEYEGLIAGRRRRARA